MNKREEERLRKQQEKLEKEIARTEAMSVFEKEYSDHQAICGIDEVGRGPFAGPVVARAVIPCRERGRPGIAALKHDAVLRVVIRRQQI